MALRMMLPNEEPLSPGRGLRQVGRNKTMPDSVTITMTRDQLIDLIRGVLNEGIAERISRDEWQKFRDTLLKPEDIRQMIEVRANNIREELDQRFLRESNGVTATIDAYQKQMQTEMSDIRKTFRSQMDGLTRTIAAQGQNISEINATAVQINANLIAFQKSYDQRLEDHKIAVNDRQDRQRKLIMDNHEQVSNRLQDLETNGMIDHTLIFGNTTKAADVPPSLYSRFAKVELGLNALQSTIRTVIKDTVHEELKPYELGLRHGNKQAQRDQWRTDLRKKARATAMALLTDPKVWFGVLSFLGSWIATFLTWWSQHH